MPTDICRFSYECRDCHEVMLLDLSMADVTRWKAGELIQNVFPHLTDDMRELMISGTCGKCFDQLFPDSGDEDDYDGDCPAF